MENNLTFNVKTLGCKVNQVESEEFIQEMIKNGFVYRPQDLKQNIIIVNTCTVTSKADKKSLITIKRSVKNSDFTFVTGCYSELEKDILNKETKIHSIIEHKNKKKMTDIIKNAVQNQSKRIDISKSVYGKMHKINSKDINNNQSTFFQHTRSFVKIQDGCNDFCTYCRIPFSRGVPVSRSIEDILDQIRILKNNNIPEVVLTGINLGKYQDGNINFAKALKLILNESGDMGVRISSIEPMTINDEVIDSMMHKNIVPHIHLSLQSGSNEVLKAMGRNYTTDDFYNLTYKLKQIDPYFSITTDVIVGFPTETNKEFEESVDFIKKCQFTKLHVFPFSKRPLTKAYDLDDCLTDGEKKIRVNQLMDLSKELYINYLSLIKKNTQKFIIEKPFDREKSVYGFVNNNSDFYFKKFKYYYSGVSQYYVRGVLGSNKMLFSKDIVQGNISKEIEPILI